MRLFFVVFGFGFGLFFKSMIFKKSVYEEGRLRVVSAYSSVFRD